MTREEFIKRAQEIHKDEKLDYSKVVYKNNRTPVLIIDNEYGEFWQTPYNHLKGQSHPLRRGKKIAQKKSFTKETFIQKAKEIHEGEKLDYSQVEYINMHTKVKIISHDLDENGNEYGEFWQEPSVHLKGCSHPNIGKKKQSLSNRYTTEIFINKAKSLYCDKYSYDKVNYINSKTKVIITCNRHGDFLTSPDLFLQGKSCPICGKQLSKVEDEIYTFLKEHITEKIIRNDQTILSGLEVDLFIPDKKIAIEYNGLRWHSEKYGKSKNYHLNKTKECKKKGIILIQIFEDEYLDNKELILNKLLHILGYDNSIKIGARKTNIKEISTKDAKIFLNKNHIQGFSNSSVYIGSFYENKLIAVMSFLKEKNCWNLTRYATDINYTCQGCASKILSYFKKNYKPEIIKSFLDIRWCYNYENNLYIKLGFYEDEILKPNYHYTNGHGKRIHKFNMRKQILHKRYGFPLTMTESMMTKKLGYDKIWDCGLIRYVWKNNEKGE